MHHNPYTVEALIFAVALLNDPPNDVSHLQQRCSDAALLSDFVAHRGDHQATLEVLDAFADIVDRSDPQERASKLNEHLARYLEHPRLTDHDGSWHLHYRDPGASLSTVLATMIFGRAASYLAENGMSRLGRCRLSECNRAYIDLSRNGRQRYCSPTCSNRDAVRRHRARTAATKSPASSPRHS